jgi:Flp pilus assembly protein TadG
MTVEAALLFTLLLTLTFATIEYSWFLLKRQEITNAARSGARIGIRPGVTNAEVQAQVAALMDAAGISGYQLTISPDVSLASPGDSVQVAITVAYSDIELGGPAFVPIPDELHASVSMAKEGP